VIAGIDMLDFAGHARTEVAQEEQGGLADIFDGDVAAKRGVELVPTQNDPEIANAAIDGPTNIGAVQKYTFVASVGERAWYVPSSSSPSKSPSWNTNKKFGLNLLKISSKTQKNWAK